VLSLATAVVKYAGGHKTAISTIQVLRSGLYVASCGGCGWESGQHESLQDADDELFAHEAAEHDA
jgi:hypothetical protein